jgi:hypothetical protein
MKTPIAIELTREQIDRANYSFEDCLGATAAKDHFKTDDVICGGFMHHSKRY